MISNDRSTPSSILVCSLGSLALLASCANTRQVERLDFVAAPASIPSLSSSAAWAATPAAQADDTFQEGGDWAVTLAGSGNSDKDAKNGVGSINVGASKFLTKDWELGLRQNISYANSDVGDAWVGATRVAIDYNFLDGAFQPMLGANFGFVYGDAVKESMTGAPELGFKWFILDEVYVQFLAEYLFFFNSADEAEEAFSDGQWLYSLGFGVLLR